MSILKYRDYLKPFQYPWAYEAYKTQQRVHWLPEEVHLNDDIRDWNDKLNNSERSLLTQIFRFFTQADVDVSSGYIDKYMPAIKPPEIRMMMSSFAAMEAVHIDAYSLLIDTIGMPESEYKAFHEFEEMSEKHDYLWRTEMPKLEVDTLITEEMQEVWDLAVNLAKFSAFSEGLQLFSSFAILLNFKRFGKMNNMGQIIAWSVRDETLHVESMIRVFKTLVEENPWLKETNLEKAIAQVGQEMINLEHKFIDLVFAHGGVEGLTSEEVKEYVNYIGNTRMRQLGYSPVFKNSDGNLANHNPLPWVHWMIAGSEHQNFFEGRSTSYSKASLKGNWDESFAEIREKYIEKGVINDKR